MVITEELIAGFPALGFVIQIDVMLFQGIQSKASIQKPTLITSLGTRSLHYWWLGFDRCSHDVITTDTDVTVLQKKSIAISRLHQGEPLPEAIDYFKLTT